MTDTTDQQAVTVAQEDFDWLAAAFEQDGATATAAGIRSGETCIINSRTVVDAIARARLASVSSASAEGVDFRALLIEAGRNAGAFIDDRASDAFLKFIPEEVRLKIERVSASPEPVPATNQAGEVERLRAAAERVQRRVGEWDSLAGHEPRDRFAAFGENLRHDAMALVVATLATQPATSQEGEDAAILAMSNAERAIERPDLPPLTALRMTAPEYERLRAMYRALAATPTPPTLSEDLRDIKGAVETRLPPCLLSEVYLSAKEFCAELCEDGPDLPQSQMKALHAALDAYEASRDV